MTWSSAGVTVIRHSATLEACAKGSVTVSLRWQMTESMN